MVQKASPFFNGTNGNKSSSQYINKVVFPKKFFYARRPSPHEHDATAHTKEKQIVF